jgi:hypothetical protein
MTSGPFLSEPRGDFNHQAEITQPRTQKARLVLTEKIDINQFSQKKNVSTLNDSQNWECFSIQNSQNRTRRKGFKFFWKRFCLLKRMGWEWKLSGLRPSGEFRFGQGFLTFPSFLSQILVTAMTVAKKLIQFWQMLRPRGRAPSTRSIDTSVPNRSDCLCDYCSIKDMRNG